MNQRQFKKYLGEAEALHSEFGVTPLTITLIQHGFHHPLLKKYLREWYLPTSVVECIGDKINWFISADFLRAQEHFVVDTIKRDRSLVKTVIRESRRQGKAIDLIVRKIDTASSKGVTAKRAALLLIKLFAAMEQLCAYGFIAVLSDLYYFTFTRELTTLIEQYAASQGSAQPVKEYVSILITPTVKTVTWKYKQALFQLALKIARLGITRPANPPKLIISNKILLKQAQQIVREFYAVNYGHRGPALTLKAIISEVADLVSKNKVHRAYRAFISEHTAIRAKQCRYIRRLKLSKQAVYLLEAAKQFIYIKGFRLEKLYQSYAAIDRLLSQVTDHKISLDNLKRCSKFEVLRFLKDGKLPTARELTRRTRHLTYTAWQHTKAKIRTGAAAGRYLQTFVAKTKDNKVRFSVHGNIACAGRATGTAKIVQSGKDMQKVREGDILVAVQTIPELLPAMKKAAAFVTDIGGITSHAAIVSREMGKPCVIGTRVATQVFKDGDLVEVDAIKGIVQKI